MIALWIRPPAYLVHTHTNQAKQAASGRGDSGREIVCSIPLTVTGDAHEVHDLRVRCAGSAHGRVKVMSVSKDTGGVECET